MIIYDIDYQHHMIDWRKLSGLSKSGWTFVWRSMFFTEITSYHARASRLFRSVCSCSVRPNKCLCLSQGRGLQHPRRKVTGLSYHFHKQCVSLNTPGHNGLFSGPRWRPTSGWALAYLISNRTTESFDLHDWLSQTSSCMFASPKIVWMFPILTPHMTRARREVVVPRHNSVPATSTQSPKYVYGVDHHA